MKLRTFLLLLRGGQLRALASLSKTARDYHRVAFLGAGLASGWLQRLAPGPVALETLAADLQVPRAMADGLRAWLQTGVALGELALRPGGYVLKGKLCKMLTKPEHDAAAAFVEEMVYLHNTLIAQSPARLRLGQTFALADQDARMIARSSRLVEPFIHEALEEVLPRTGPLRLLEIGCGAAAYIRLAALWNPELKALGVELQEEAAALAMENIAQWNLSSRVSIEVGDIRQRSPDATFDLATLHQNIYYFPVAERTNLLRHVRSFLKTGGRLLLTSVCQGRGSTAAVLDLWGALTAGCGRLPRPREMVTQMEEAGFTRVTGKSPIPGESFCVFVGTNPGAGQR
jgi:protein-L-isoaspartate O-methyltransferase